MKFPEFPATFPEVEPKSADYGQNLQKSVRENEKFPAKFPEAGKSRAGYRPPAVGFRLTAKQPGKETNHKILSAAAALRMGVSSFGFQVGRKAAGY